MTLVVGQVHFTSDSLTGRGTKCYLAYDMTDCQVVFCKEYWRVDLPTSHPEGDVYVDLHQHGVQFIPTLIAAGNVRHGKTSMFSMHTQNLLPDKQPGLILYQLLLEEIAEPLENYKDSKELVLALYKCITGLFFSASLTLAYSFRTQLTNKHGRRRKYCIGTSASTTS